MIIIYVGPKNLTMPKLADLPPSDVAVADVVIVMNRIATTAEVVKYRDGSPPEAFVVYLGGDT